MTSKCFVWSFVLNENSKYIYDDNKFSLKKFDEQINNRKIFDFRQ